ncbi:NAD(P)-binding protein [Streptomyces sp. NPDC098077]|uniref:NAD(P)-binding protein n=1 Tax=Streptomyces sp. NPDC098077 TaxID=3366093 RepID=UPI00380B19B8
MIVGAGPNGLAAGVTLGRGGLRVELYERDGQIGGGLRTTSAQRCTQWPRPPASSVSSTSLRAASVWTGQGARLDRSVCRPPVSLAPSFGIGPCCCE